MKRFILTIALLSSALVAGAQTSIEEVLRSVETNNKELQANRQMVTAQKLEAKLDNNLPDPTVTYSHLYGNKEGMGFTGELVASQSFDFPSLYMQRNKLSKQIGMLRPTGRRSAPADFVASQRSLPGLDLSESAKEPAGYPSEKRRTACRTLSATLGTG